MGIALGGMDVDFCAHPFSATASRSNDTKTKIDLFLLLRTYILR
jgi:hypothetical protein